MVKLQMLQRALPAGFIAACPPTETDKLPSGGCMLAKAGLGLRFKEDLEGNGPTVFAHACKMGPKGIVSKRKDSLYRSGRSRDWLKMKEPGLRGS